jgi:hypothetical protein
MQKTDSLLRSECQIGVIVDYVNGMVTLLKVLVLNKVPPLREAKK